MLVVVRAILVTEDLTAAVTIEPVQVAEEVEVPIYGEMEMQWQIV